jgi:hypothetical protein
MAKKVGTSARGRAMGLLVLLGAPACAEDADRRFGAPGLRSDDEMIREIDRDHDLREGVIHLPFAGDVEILYAVIEGQPIWAGDILLSDAELQGFRAAAVNRLWPNGNIKYAFDASLPEAVRTGVLESMDDWAGKTGVRFVEVEEPAGGGYVKIQRGNGGCNAYLGYYGEGTVHELNFGEGCEYASVYAHELGHVLGLHHEQSRSDRDDHVTIHWDNIEPGNAYNYDKYEKHEPGQDRGAYDFDSIMHYGSDAFAIDHEKPAMERKGGGLIAWPSLISAGDALAVSAMYAAQPEGQAADDPGAAGTGCTGHCGSLEVTPAGCYCDAGCVEYGDCCPDQAAVCGGGDQGAEDPPGGAATCAGHCGSADGRPDGNGGLCYCDELCVGNGDCCGDHAQQCGGNGGGGNDGAVGSCVNHCGAEGSQGDGCYCDAQCEVQGDCCPDYAAACGANGGGGNVGPSCAGHCHSEIPVDGCYCDAQCLEQGDCCPDYGTVCQ